jgi:TPR repeat protein
MNKMRFAAVIVLAILLVPVVAVAGPLEDGKAAFARHDYQTGLKLLLPLAAQGNAEAENIFGYAYEKGFGVNKDDAESAGWYQHSAERGNAAAQCEIALMYDSGFGMPKDHVEAVKLFQTAAEQGNVAAQFYLGGMYEENRGGVPQNEAEAFKWYLAAAKQGDNSAQKATALMYEFGKGTPQDYIEAAKWYRKAAEQGDGSGQLALGLLYAHSTPANLEQAYAWLSVAVTLNNTDAGFARNEVTKLLSPSALVEAGKVSTRYIATYGHLAPVPLMPDCEADLSISAGVRTAPDNEAPAPAEATGKPETK